MNAFSLSRILELEELIGTPSFKLSPSINVERPVNIPIPKMTAGENGEAGHSSGDSVGKKRKVCDNDTMV